MGIHFSEIEEIGGLNKDKTRQLAQELWGLASDIDGIDRQKIEDVLVKYGDISIENLKDAGWLDSPEDAAKRGIVEGKFSFSNKTGAIANAPKEERMRFDEAIEQIKTVVERLNNAPDEIEGIRINNMYLYGSSIRDNNTRDTIGDIDLAADFGFDKRYDDMEREECVKIAKKLWNEVIAKGDERLQIGTVNGLIEMPNTVDRPFGIITIWQNKNFNGTSLTRSEQEAIKEREQVTIANNSRAKIVSESLKAKNLSRFTREPVKTKPKKTAKHKINPSQTNKNSL